VMGEGLPITATYVAIQTTVSTPVHWGVRVAHSIGFRDTQWSKKAIVYLTNP